MISKMIGLKKDYDGMFDFCYDYDINFIERSMVEKDYFDNKKDFYVLKARFLFKKNKIKKVLHQHLINERRKELEIQYNLSDKTWIAGLINNPKQEKYSVSSFKLFKAERKAAEEAFVLVKEQMEQLALNGDARALALCLKYSTIDERLMELVEKIKNKSLKTPEELEVLANLYCKEIPEDSLRLKLGLDAEDIAAKIEIYHKDYIGALEFHEESQALTYLSNMQDNLKMLSGTKFANNFEKVQLAYYKRYFIGYGSVSDLASYLEVTKRGKSIFVEEEVFAPCSNGVLYSRSDIERILKRTYIKNKSKNTYISDKLAFAEVMLDGRQEEKALDMLKDIASLKLTSDKQQCQKEENFVFSQMIYEINKEL